MPPTIYCDWSVLTTGAPVGSPIGPVLARSSEIRMPSGSTVGYRVTVDCPMPSIDQFTATDGADYGLDHTLQLRVYHMVPRKASATPVADGALLPYTGPHAGDHVVFHHAASPSPPPPSPPPSPPPPSPEFVPASIVDVRVDSNSKGGCSGPATVNIANGCANRMSTRSIDMRNRCQSSCLHDGAYATCAR